MRQLHRSRKPRVVIVYHFFAHYRAAIMQGLLDSKDIEYFLVGDREEPDRSIEAWQPPKERWMVTRCVKVAGNMLWQTGLLKLALRHDIDAFVFLGNVNFLSTWCSAALARFKGKRVLFWTHGWIRDESGLKNQIRKCFYRLAHGLLLYGNRAKLIGMKNGFASEALYVVYNSLDYSKQRAIRENISDAYIKNVRTRLFPDSSAPVLICTGRLIKLKRLDLLLEAMCILRMEKIETCLLLVGDGPEQPALEKLAHAEGLTVHFYGACYDENRLAELIMAANVAVSPGQVGLTAMHSLAYGVPVITHDDSDTQMPESEAILPGRTGDLFRRGDARDLAQVLKKWVCRPWPDLTARQESIAMMERCYNPAYQEAIIAHAVAGLPAR